MSGLGKCVRGFALAMMFFLSVAANCTSDSYDPNPYDDTPPVTVEFEYVAPQVSTAPSTRQDLTNSLAGTFEAVVPPFNTPRLLLNGSYLDSTVQPSAHVSAPLRR